MAAAASRGRLAVRQWFEDARTLLASERTRLLRASGRVYENVHEQLRAVGSETANGAQPILFAYGVKSCIFCRSDLADVGRSREHILPRWLQEAWQLPEQFVEPTHFDEKFNVISRRRHTFNSFVAGNVCGPCNNGWMSALEVQCKDLILDLASGRRQILGLQDHEALRLARWTAKTAFVLHTSANWRRVVPPEHIYKLDIDSYRLPERVFVVGHTYNRGSQEFSWSQGTTWEIRSREYTVSPKDLENIKAVGYKIAIRLGGLFLLIFHNPLPFARPCLWKYRHVPLYPRWSHPVAWRIGDRAWPHKGDVRFHVFVQMLSLSIDRSEPDGPSKGSLPIRSATNQTPSVAGSCR